MKINMMNFNTLAPNINTEWVKKCYYWLKKNATYKCKKRSYSNNSPRGEVINNR